MYTESTHVTLSWGKALQLISLILDLGGLHNIGPETNLGKKIRGAFPKKGEKIHMETVNIGTFCFDGKPQKACAKYDGEQISFGPIKTGHCFQAIRLKNGSLFPTRCLCCNISWQELDAMGLIFGTVVQIGKDLYLCRCLEVADEENVSDEWSAIVEEMEEAKESNLLLNFEEVYVWGQGPAKRWPNSKVVRGYYEPNGWYGYDPGTRSVKVGFRPLFEPLRAVPLDYKPLVGKVIAPMNAAWRHITGVLLSYSDYDLVLENASPVPEDCRWAAQVGNHVIIDRDAVRWLREV